MCRMGLYEIAFGYLSTPEHSLFLSSVLVYSAKLTDLLYVGPHGRSVLRGPYYSRLCVAKGFSFFEYYIF